MTTCRQHCRDSHYKAKVNVTFVSKWICHCIYQFKHLGIDKFTFHCLRHCFSTFHSDSGADVFTTQSLLGHSTLSQTAHYTHKKIDAKRKAVDDMTEHVLDMCKKVAVTEVTRNEGTT